MDDQKLVTLLDPSISPLVDRNTKAVVEDLGRFGGALDKAVMKFHSMKMEETWGLS